MNSLLRRTLTRVLLQTTTANHQQQQFSTAIAGATRRARKQNKAVAPEEEAKWARPKEIPYQPKLANRVELIGRVSRPVEFLSCPDGKFRAATLISHSSCAESAPPPPSLWIPIIFEGDLAHVAAAHLKERDCVYVSGQLAADPPPLDIVQGQAQLQVMVQMINFVVGAEINKSLPPLQLEDGSDAKVDASVDQSWKDLLVKPHEWWDIRSPVDDSKGAAFENKENGKLLWIDGSIPEWIQQNLDFIMFDQKPAYNREKAVAMNNGIAAMDPWKNLLDNPKDWWDNRSRKQNGLIKPNSPDFKSKDGSHALWLNRAPKWVLEELDQIHTLKERKQDKAEELWKDLVTNPTKWWDNRMSKKNVRGPDFKRKDTGEALWLSSSPSWVLSQLPPLEREKTTGSS